MKRSSWESQEAGGGMRNIIQIDARAGMACVLLLELGESAPV